MLKIIWLFKFIVILLLYQKQNTMDVGFSNQNHLGKIAPELADVVFIVECDGHSDQFNLWKDYSKKSSSNIKHLSNEDIEQLTKILGDNFVLLEKVKRLSDKVEYNNHTRYDWEEVSSGFMLTIGNVEIGGEKLPVCVSFSFAYINGHKICFYYTSSRVHDHTMVDEWFQEHFQLTHDGYTRWNHVDANNFHNCVNSLDNLDKEPRNVSSIDLMTPRAIMTNWYPGSPFSEGDVLTRILGDSPRFKGGLSKEWRYWDKDFEHWVWDEAVESADANFRELQWWENRDITEMPAYIQDNFFPVTIPETVNPNYHRIYKVKEHNVEEHGENGCVVEYNNDELYIPYNHALPATEEQFKNQ